MYIADLHIHSKYSRATSPEGDAPHLDLWARKKGITLVGTGDFTHPVWREQLHSDLVPAEEGLYTLKDDLRLPSGTAESTTAPRFIVTGEISSIYKKNGKTRKIHNLILLPGLDAADAIAKKLEAIGNIHSDGRPILGLDSRDLLEIVLETSPGAIFIPAHIWTPHFALFGAFSGFDTIEECFEDLTGEIHAVETGLSSDPPMNWRISALDRFTLVSNSDAHSPSKLGREANLLDTGLSYPELKHAIETGSGFGGTIEFFPEEGKYHLDGHRNCNLSLTPEETEKLGGKCPVCGKKITIGVLHRVLELADRPEGYRPPDAKPFESLIPLPEVIAASTGNSTASKKTEAMYNRMLQELGPEFTILREIPVESIEQTAGACIAEGISRLRARNVERIAGYDGKYGKVVLFDEEERDTLSGQTMLFDMPKAAGKTTRRETAAEPSGESFSAQTGKTAAEQTAVRKDQPDSAEKTPVLSVSAPGVLTEQDSPHKTSGSHTAGQNRDGLNDEQFAAVTAAESAVAVIAGSGTGKTKTLVARIAYLIESCGVRPEEITAVTFTNKAAAEMRERLEKRLGGKQNIRGLTAGTFHAVCLQLLDDRPILSETEAQFLVRNILESQNSKKPAKAVLRAISDIKNGVPVQEAGIDTAVYESYCAQLKEMGLRDLDDVLLDALSLEQTGNPMFTYLLIDEFQDTNPVQRKLVRRWSTGGKNIFVIGDPDQSIYGFRGARSSCFSELQQDFPALRIITLRKNYRSTPEIIAGALPVIAHNSGKKRELAATQPAGAAVRVLTAGSTLSEGIWIAKEIAGMTGGLGMLDAQNCAPDRRNVRPFSDIAVLCRTHRQLGSIEYCLQHDSIPYVVSGRGSELDDPAVQGALAFFRFLRNPADTVALTAALCLVRNLSVKQAHKIMAADEYGNGPDPAWSSSITHEKRYMLLKKNGCPQEFLADIDTYLPQLDTKQPQILLEQWTAEHGKNSATEQLLNLASFHLTMAELLDILTLGKEADLHRASGKNYAAGAVQLMTLHGSKGLEFPVVFLAGIDKDKLPLERKGAAVDIEEERRLFYVGMTRAKEELVLSAAAPVSAFLSELPDSVQHCAPALHHRGQETQQLELF